MTQAMNADEVKALARRYSMLVQWSDSDQVYVVSLPEWEAQAGLHGHTHGGTYDEAVRAGEEVIELLVEAALANGEVLPEPKVYASAN